MKTGSESTDPTRRRDLDVTRELIVFSLIFFHTLRIFDDMDYYVKNDPVSGDLNGLVGLAALWGMPLLFVIAGFSIERSLGKRSVGKFVKERSQRLMVPYIFGLILVAPPQVFFKEAGNPDFTLSYFAFYPEFFDIKFRLSFPWFYDSRLFEPTNLWFLHILLLYTLLMLPLFVWLRSEQGRAVVAKTVGYASHPVGLIMLALPIGLVEAAFGSSSSGGWGYGAYSLLLLYGFLLAADPRLGQSLATYRWLLLGLVVLTTVGAVVWFTTMTKDTPDNLMYGMDQTSLLFRLFKGFWGWAWVAMILGLIEASRHKRFTRDNAPYAEPRPRFDALERYARRASLPVYVVHQVIIVAIGFYVVQWPIGGWGKFLTISLSALVMSLLAYELIIKRTAVTRFLFGVKTV